MQGVVRKLVLPIKRESRVKILLVFIFYLQFLWHFV